jgi:hypothetical protein
MPLVVDFEKDEPEGIWHMYPPRTYSCGCIRGRQNFTQSRFAPARKVTMWLELDFRKMTHRDAGTYRFMIELRDDKHQTSYKKSLYWMTVEIEYWYSRKFALPSPPPPALDPGPDPFAYDEGPNLDLLLQQPEYAVYKRRLLVKPLRYINRRSRAYQEDFNDFANSYRGKVNQTR